MKLAPKHARFVAEYRKDLNATQAAIRAGYSRKTARAQGARLLTDADIAGAIAQQAAAALERAELSADRVLEELRRLAFSDVRGLFDEAGNLKPLKDLTPEQAAAIGSIEVVKKNLAAGDGEVDTVIKIKTWDKTRSLEMLAKHFALLTDVVKHTTDDANIAKLLAGRKRAAEAKR